MNLLSFGPIGLDEVLTLGVIAVVVVYPLWRIFERIGYDGWLSLLLFIPLVNLILIWRLAYADWPALRRGPWS